MKTIFEPTKGMLPVDTSYCPGCSHGIAHRLIMEVLEERGDLGRTIGVVPIGCSINAHNFMNIDMCESTHGRAPAIATGIRRVHPDKVVFTYQGDGDLASIGAGEIVHAAHRGEKFTTFFINSGISDFVAAGTKLGRRSIEEETEFCRIFFIHYIKLIVENALNSVSCSVNLGDFIGFEGCFDNAVCACVNNGSRTAGLTEDTCAL